MLAWLRCPVSALTAGMRNIDIFKSPYPALAVVAIGGLGIFVATKYIAARPLNAYCGAMIVIAAPELSVRGQTDNL